MLQHIWTKGRAESFDGPLQRIEINWKRQLCKWIFPAVRFGSPSLSHILSVAFSLSRPPSLVGFEILLVMMLFWKRTTAGKSAAYRQQHTVPKQPHFSSIWSHETTETGASESSVSYHRLREGRQ